MGTPYMSEIRIFSFNFAPKGWALCNGQLLPINQNQALFSLLGTTYGGNGQTNFALPNLQGRAPVHMGSLIEGQTGGEENHTLIQSELPAHTHVPSGNSGTPNAGLPTNNTWAANAANPYSSSSPDTTMNPAAIAAAGGSQPHNNLQPYLVLNFCIALQGVFPSRN
jgi:microcystin-dependent protein